MIKSKRQRQFSLSALEQKAREESLANESAIYGELLPMVQFIRARGWVTFKEGFEFRVGTKLLGPEGIRDIYRREKEREARERNERLASFGPERESPARDNREAGVPRRPAPRRRSPGNKKRPTGGGVSPSDRVEEREP